MLTGHVMSSDKCIPKWYFGLYLKRLYPCKYDLDASVAKATLMDTD